MTSPEPQTDRLVDAKSPPWSIGDIVICVVGGVAFGLIATFGLVLLVTAIAGWARPRDSVLYLISGGSIYLMVALFVWLRLVKNRGISWTAIGFRPARPGALLLMVPLTLVVLILSGIVAEMTAQLFGDVPDAADQLAVTPSGVSIVDLVCFLLMVAVIGPAVEELVFRGLLQEYVRARWGVGAALAIGSFAFAVIHFIPLLLGVFLLMGLIFGLVVERTGSLYPAILLHSLNNAASVFILFFTFN